MYCLLHSKLTSSYSITTKWIQTLDFPKCTWTGTTTQNLKPDNSLGSKNALNPTHCHPNQLLKNSPQHHQTNANGNVFSPNSHLSLNTNTSCTCLRTCSNNSRTENWLTKGYIKLCRHMAEQLPNFPLWMYKHNMQQYKNWQRSTRGLSFTKR